MEPPTFGGLYAGHYDSIYAEKDYEAECDAIERAFRDYGKGGIRRVADFGCGTGGHALPLASRGYQVVGVDRSNAMVQTARAKAAPGPTVEFHVADIRDVDLRISFDAVVMMFAVLGYMQADEDVLRALRSARRHLQPRGLFVFDVWYGPAVVGVPPERRVRDIPTRTGHIHRVATPEIDDRRHLCRVTYSLQVTDERGRQAETVEHHDVRFFFPDEIEQFLSDSGFDLCRLGAFPNFDQPPQDDNWSALVVARAA